MVQPTYGLPGEGNVNIGPWQQLQAMYPYVTFGPQMAQQLANLQFGAGLDAQNQNNQLSMQLAQGAASNRFADNIASKLALNGMGSVPGFGSAFGGGNWGVQQIQPPNILDIYKQMNSGLGNIFGTAQSLPGQGGGVMGGGTQAFGGRTQPSLSNPALAPFMSTQPFGNTPSGPTPGNPGWSGVDQMNALRSGNTALAQYIASVVNGSQSYNPDVANRLGATLSNSPGRNETLPFDPTRSNFGGGKMGATQPRTPMAVPAASQSPFAGLHQLAFGQGGFGPSYFSAGMLGSGSPGFGAPRTNLTGYYGASPDQREAQDYFMQSQAGYSPQQLAYERQTFTPGARMFGR